MRSTLYDVTEEDESCRGTMPLGLFGGRGGGGETDVDKLEGRRGSGGFGLRGGAGRSEGGGGGEV